MMCITVSQTLGYVMLQNSMEKTIRVTGIASNIEDDVIIPVFESSRNGGGPVKSIEGIRRLPDNSVLVTFESSDGRDVTLCELCRDQNKTGQG